MMPSNARLLTCPACGGKKKILSLASGNTFDGEVWSDLKKIYPMLPEPSFVQKCPECGNYYLLSRQKTVEYDKEFRYRFLYILVRYAGIFFADLVIYSSVLFSDI